MQKTILTKATINKPSEVYLIADDTCQV
eukprot:COSAG02_NODE_15865_length_1135_cov_1.056950_2_plen_27_part_01